MSRQALSIAGEKASAILRTITELVSGPCEVGGEGGKEMMDMHHNHSHYFE